MKTLTITIPTGTTGNLSYFKIEFKGGDFLKVVDAVEKLRTPNDLLELEKTDLIFIK